MELFEDPIWINHPWAYFDGSAQDQGCGGGVLLHISITHSYNIQMGQGARKKKYDELITLRHFLDFSLNHYCRHLQILRGLQSPYKMVQ